MKEKTVSGNWANMTKLTDSLHETKLSFLEFY